MTTATSSSLPSRLRGTSILTAIDIIYSYELSSRRILPWRGGRGRCRRASTTTDGDGQ